mmetsp:Transcript_47198/g.117773  ORF Transcript_47198/g.117773 Transcript_47198/m.117773 type:complete len:133 (-) Transcript_47198:564-962(-)
MMMAPPPNASASPIPQQRRQHQHRSSALGGEGEDVHAEVAKTLNQEREAEMRSDASPADAAGQKVGAESSHHHQANNQANNIDLLMDRLEREEVPAHLINNSNSSSPINLMQMQHQQGQHQQQQQQQGAEES